MQEILNYLVRYVECSTCHRCLRGNSPRKGEPFSFPGGPSFVWEAADADLVADVMVWAAQSPRAANEAFNITNGDVFEWRSLWPALARTLGIETGPDELMSVAAFIEKNADVWNTIVAKYDLRSQSLRELVGQGDQHLDFAFAYGAPEGPRAFVSTIKLRQAGFTKTLDTADSFRKALQSLIDRKLLPPLQSESDPEPRPHRHPTSRKPAEPTLEDLSPALMKR
jgi:hypothetical protein